MPKKRRKKDMQASGEDYEMLEPNESIPFDPVEFQMGMAYALEMGRGPAGVLNNPNEASFSIKDGRKTEHFALADKPINRFTLAMSQRYRDNNVKYWSFMWRWFAFMDLVRSKTLDGTFQMRTESDDQVHPYVIELAGSFPVGSNGKFNRPAFVAALKRRMVKDNDAT